MEHKFDLACFTAQFKKQIRVQRDLTLVIKTNTVLHPIVMSKSCKEESRLIVRCLVAHFITYFYNLCQLAFYLLRGWCLQKKVNNRINNNVVISGTQKRGEGEDKGEREKEQNPNPNTPSLFPFLPIPYPFRCLQCRLSLHCILNSDFVKSCGGSITPRLEHRTCSLEAPISSPTLTAGWICSC